MRLFNPKMSKKSTVSRTLEGWASQNINISKCAMIVHKTHLTTTWSRSGGPLGRFNFNGQ